MNEPVRKIIIKKEEDIIPQIKESITSEDIIPSVTKSIVIPNTSSNLNNEQEAINKLIESIGLDKYKNSHLANLIETDGNINDIAANWLSIGTTNHEGKTIESEVIKRKEEFSLFVKQ